MIDAQHFAVGFAFQGSGLAQRVGDGDQVLALVEAVGGVFTRAILEAFDLGPRCCTTGRCGLRRASIITIEKVAETMLTATYVDEF
jgi:hypothetical protein